MPRSDAEDRLEWTFSNAAEWLKFAEAKNAAILTFDTAALLALLSYEPKSWYCAPLAFWTAMFAGFAFLSLAVSLLSFLASVRIPGETRLRQIHEDDANIIFFGDLALLKRDQLLKAHGYSLSDSAESRYVAALANQTIVISDIALRKNRWFNISLWLLIAGFATPIGALIIWGVIRK